MSARSLRSFFSLLSLVIAGHQGSIVYSTYGTARVGASKLLGFWLFMRSPICCALQNLMWSVSPVFWPFDLRVLVGSFIGADGKVQECLYGYNYTYSI